MTAQAGSLSASRNRAVWRAAAPRIDWSAEYGIESVPGLRAMPQPLVAGSDVAALIGLGAGVALFLGECWALPDAVVAAAVMAVSGLVGGEHPIMDDWPSVLSARGLRPFERCRVEGCESPTYSQKHLVAGGRRAERCIAHETRRSRAAAAVARERDEWARLLSALALDRV